MKKLCRWLLVIVLGGSLALPASAEVLFDGADDRVETADVAALDFGATDDFSVLLWINASAVTADKSIISKYTTGISPGWLMGLLANGTVEVWIRDGIGSGGNEIAIAVSTTVIEGAGWHHVAMTVERGSNVKCYIDGVSEASTSCTALTTTLANAVGVRMGGRSESSGSHIPATMSDVMIYNRELTAAEVLAHAKSRVKGPMFSGCVGYWPLNDSADGTSGDGDTFLDRAGINGANATGADGANNTGLTAKAESYLSYR